MKLLKNLRKNEEGAVLLSVVLIFAVVSIIGAMILGSSLSAMKNTSDTAAHLKAQSNADSGIDSVKGQLSTNGVKCDGIKTYTSATDPNPDTEVNGIYYEVTAKWVQEDKVTNSCTNYRYIELTSIGYSNKDKNKVSYSRTDYMPIAGGEVVAPTSSIPVTVFTLKALSTSDTQAIPVSGIQPNVENKLYLYKGSYSEVKDAIASDASDVDGICDATKGCVKDFGDVSGKTDLYSYIFNSSDIDLNENEEYQVVFRGKFSYLSTGSSSQKLLVDVPQYNPKVTETTSFSNAFEAANNFVGNSGMNNWDVSNVTNMKSMFQYASAFNQNISSWNVSKVTDVSGMFYQASDFNQDISSWNVSKVTNMRNMFQNASDFNQDISSWDVSNVKDMSYMFNSASSFNNNGKALSWGDKTSNVTDMSYMFYQASDFNQDISSWNVSKVTNMDYMFANAFSFDQDISSWNVSNVTSWSYFAFNSLLANNTSYIPATFL